MDDNLKSGRHRPYWQYFTRLIRDVHARYLAAAAGNFAASIPFLSSGDTVSDAKG